MIFSLSLSLSLCFTHTHTHQMYQRKETGNWIDTQRDIRVQTALMRGTQRLEEEEEEKEDREGPILPDCFQVCVCEFVCVSMSI